MELDPVVQPVKYRSGLGKCFYVIRKTFRTLTSQLCIYHSAPVCKTISPFNEPVSKLFGELWRLGATGELEVEFKFQRRSCKLSFLFPPAARAPRRACSQAIPNSVFFHFTSSNKPLRLDSTKVKKNTDQSDWWIGLNNCRNLRSNLLR